MLWKWLILEPTSSFAAIFSLRIVPFGVNRKRKQEVGRMFQRWVTRGVPGLSRGFRWLVEVRHVGEWRLWESVLFEDIATLDSTKWGRLKNLLLLEMKMAKLGHFSKVGDGAAPRRWTLKDYNNQLVGDDLKRAWYF